MSMRRCLSMRPVRCASQALAPYLTKGEEGFGGRTARYHSWMKNEEKRHALSVLVTDIEFADSKGVREGYGFCQGGSLRNRKRMMRIFRSREDGMHLRAIQCEIPFMLFLGLLFAVTVGWWVFLPPRFRSFSETVGRRYSPCARHFPSPSVTGLCAHPISVSSVFKQDRKDF